MFYSGCVRSTNDGDSWSEMEELTSRCLFFIEWSVHGWYCRRIIYISNKGRTWSLNLNVPKDLYVHDFAANQQYAVAATSSGIWLTIDAKKLESNECVWL